MHQDLHEIEIKNLLVIKDLSGLWKIRKIIPRAKMINVINIITEEIKTVQLKNIGPIENYQVYTKDGQIVSVEKILEKITELKEVGDLYSSATFKNLEDKEKNEYMEKLVPGFSEAFKDYHVVKILKWSEILDQYIEIANKNIKEL